MKRYLVLACATAAALAVSGSAAASVPTPVTITAQTVFGTPGTFQTSGAGLCATGTTTDQTSVSGFKSGNHTIYHVQKTFTCDDGSGTFTALLQVFSSGGGDSFSWNIVSGTGAYTNLHGSGSGVGVGFPGGIDDTYVGSVHFN
jgi:hypothetical protein